MEIVLFVKHKGNTLEFIYIVCKNTKENSQEFVNSFCETQRGFSRFQEIRGAVTGRPGLTPLADFRGEGQLASYFLRRPGYLS